MSAEIHLPLEPFMTPNYVRVRMQAGEMGSHALALKNVSAEALAKLCDEWRAAVFEKAGKRDPAAEAAK